MTTSPEINALLQAAKAVEPLIEGLMAKKKIIEDKIQSLATVIKARDSYCSGIISETDSSIKKEVVSLDTHIQPPKKRVPKGEIEWNIDKVLIGSQGYDEHTLRNLINEKFSTNYERSAFNSVLNRLKHTKYKKDGNVWKMIDETGCAEDQELKSPLAQMNEGTQ